MVSFKLGGICILLLLLCNFSSAKLARPDLPVTTLLSVPLEQKYSYRALYPRQDTGCDGSGVDDPDDLNCAPLCAPNACIEDYAPNKGRRRQSLGQNANTEEESDVWTSKNISLRTHNNEVKNNPGKRALTVLTDGEIATYLYTQLDPTKVSDENFGDPTYLVQDFEGGIESDHTVTEQVKFSDVDHAFQVGSRGLHGCTMVTVISRRAVYIGHFWERPSWVDNSEFQERVLNFISGNGVRFGIGPHLNTSLFNRIDDDTRIYILHPRLTPNSTPPKTEIPY